MHVHGRVVWLARWETATQPHIEFYLVDASAAMRVNLWLKPHHHHPPFGVGSDLMLISPRVLTPFPIVVEKNPRYHIGRELSLDESDTNAIHVHPLNVMPWATMYALQCMPAESLVCYFGVVVEVLPHSTATVGGENKAQLMTEDLRGDHVMVEVARHNATFAETVKERGGYVCVAKAICKKDGDRIYLQANSSYSVEYVQLDNEEVRHKWGLARQAAYGFIPLPLQLGVSKYLSFVASTNDKNQSDMCFILLNGNPLSSLMQTISNSGGSNAETLRLTQQMSDVQRVLDAMLRTMTELDKKVTVQSELVLASTGALQEMLLEQFEGGQHENHEEPMDNQPEELVVGASDLEAAIAMLDEDEDEDEDVVPETPQPQ